MSDVIAEIAAERKRQIEVEGWTPEHDDSHHRGDLVRAAACYAMRAASDLSPFLFLSALRVAHRELWPWETKWWKPECGVRRCLIKAAALIVAAIESMDRREQQHDR